MTIRTPTEPLDQNPPSALLGETPADVADVVTTLETFELVGMAPDVKIEEVVWRVDSEPYQSEGHAPHARYVPYIKAPIVARLLDKWVGPQGWHDEYEVHEVAGHAALLCRITIGGVTKVDVGVAPKGNAEVTVKGVYSDAFKRCGSLKWGAGRNVYELPTIWAVCQVGSNGKAYSHKDAPSQLLQELRARGYGETLTEGQP